MRRIDNARKPRSQARRPAVREAKGSGEQLVEQDLTLDEATAILKRNRVRGLANRESLRRALADKRIPSKRENRPGAPYKISAAVINALVARESVPEPNKPSAHKALLEHYCADALHNPVTALRAGIIENLDEASRVYRMFEKHAADVRALDVKEKQARWEAEQLKKSSEDLCARCGRSYFEARQESARIVAEVTGRPLDVRLPTGVTGTQFEDTETHLVAEYKGEWCCAKCGMWRATRAIPATEMKAKLDASRASTAGAFVEMLDEMGSRDSTLAAAIAAAKRTSES